MKFREIKSINFSEHEQFNSCKSDLRVLITLHFYESIFISTYLLEVEGMLKLKPTNYINTLYIIHKASPMGITNLVRTFHFAFENLILKLF